MYVYLIQFSAIPIDPSVILAPAPTFRITDRLKGVQISPPGPLKATQESRGRVNSLDSGLVLIQASHLFKLKLRHFNSPNQSLNPSQNPSQNALTPPPFRQHLLPFRDTHRWGSSCPSWQPEDNKLDSIALRAICFMRSLATMASWPQPKGSTAQEIVEDTGRLRVKGNDIRKKDEVVKEKKKKDGMVKKK